MKIPFVDLKSVNEPVKKEILHSIEKIIDDNAFILGKSVTDFENEFAKAHDVKHCIAVSSGTDANHLALWSNDIGPGDEIIIPANTFIATAWGATLCGATPVFVDCEEKSYNIDPAKIEAKITGKTKAVIAVHLYGQPAAMDELKKITDKHGLLLIEDAAQSHIAEYKKKKVGGIGKVASYSFYPAKNLGAFGEGGAVTTNDDDLAAKIRMLRDHGSSKKYYHDIYGHNYRMEGIQGAVLGIKLKELNAITDKRRALAKTYHEQLQDVEGIILPAELPYAKHVYHLFVIQTPQRDRLQGFLNDHGVSTALHYPVPLHMQKCFDHLGYKEGDFPVTEKLSSQCLSLPMYSGLSDVMADYVCEKIREFFKA